MYPEIIGAILSVVGILLLCTSLNNMIKQTACVIVGIIGFEVLVAILRKNKARPAMGVLAGVLSLALLAANVAIGISENGAQNWITIYGITFQPSELVKVCLAIQAAGLRSDTSRLKFYTFTFFSAVSVLTMAAINDFGTALIFFIAYLAVALDRQRFAMTGLAAVSAAGAGFAAVKLRPHIAARFLSYGKAWENAATTGYQQTRTMIAIASGGLFGVGLGRGWLRNITAADTDMVFGIVCEEMGLLTGIVTIVMILFLGIKTLTRPNGSGAIAAATMLMTQMALNVLGSVDIVPFTGVTFPFISRGGTSILACWGLLAVINGDENV